MFLRFLSALVLFAFANTCFAAEIYRCVDENNVKSFSNKPCPDSTFSGDSLPHTLWRSLKELTLQGIHINQSLSGDIKSIMHCESSVKKLSASIAEHLDHVNNLKDEHPNLSKAYRKLQDCAECRAGARFACDNAYEHLQHAMNGIMASR